MPSNKEGLLEILAGYTIGDPSILEKLDGDISIASCAALGADFFAFEKFASVSQLSLEGDAEWESIQCYGMGLIAILPVEITKGNDRCKIVVHFTYNNVVFEPTLSNSAVKIGLVAADLCKRKYRPTSPEDFSSLQPRVRKHAPLSPEELEAIGYHFPEQQSKS